MTSVLAHPGGPHELSDAAGPSSSSTPTSSTSASAPPPPSSSSSSNSGSDSLFSKVKRRLSTRKASLKEHLPARLLLRRESKSGGGAAEEASTASVPPGGVDGCETQGDGTMEHPRAYTIAPPDYRANTTLRAVTDSFPLLTSLHAPSFSLSLPSFGSSSSRGGTSSPSVPCFGADGYDDSDDESPSPPLPSAVKRRNSPPFFSSSSSSSPPLSSSPSATPPRRGSDPSKPASTPSTSTSTSNASDDPLDRLYGNVLMLGGYRGSVLRDAKTHKRLWIPLRVGFGFRQADLGLGLEDEDELRSEETVVPGNMLCAIGGVVDLGKKLKAKLKSVQAAQHPPSPHPSFPFTSPPPSPAPDPLRPPLTFHSWGYDWRRSLELSSASLLSFLERLKRESAARGEGEGGRGVGATVIAHSMGGLVVMHALARAEDPSVFRGIVFAGTPFQGCVNILGALKLGGAVPRNPKTGDPATVLSWRSCFYFLPRPPAVVAPPPEEGTQEREICRRVVEEELRGSGVDGRGWFEREGEGEGEEEEREEEVDATPRAAPAALPPAVGDATAPPPSKDDPAALYPTSPLTPTPFQTSTAPSRSHSSSSASTSSTSSRSSPSAETPYTTSAPSPSHLSSKPQLVPLPPSSRLHPDTHLPALSTLLSGCFETPEGIPLPVDFFDPDSYSRYALSPAVAGMNLSKDRSAAVAAPAPVPVADKARGAEGGGGGGPLAGAPGNLGERALPIPGLDNHSASPIEAAASGVEALQREMSRLTASAADRVKGEEVSALEREAEERLRAEEERLRRQVREEETVRGYLERCLARAQKFHSDIIDLHTPSKAHLYPPVSVLTSRSTPTVRGVLSTSRTTIAEEGYDRLLWAAGDGIVLYETATRLPGDPEVRGGKRGEGDDKWQGLLKGVVETQNGHVSMLGDLDGVRECVRLLYG
ncbi:hypothetical protein JCM6882_000368 [Rhodosporidiobolus microsporus]